MPNTPGAKKRHRQSLVRRLRNRATKAELKSSLRKIAELVKANKVAEAETEFRATTKKLDKAASSKVIHANRASRVKSRVSARLKAAKKKATPA